MGIFDKQIDSAVEAAFNKQLASLETSTIELTKRVAELKAERDAIQTERDAAKRIKDLQEQIARLEITKGQIEENNARDRRETLHMVGLERKRQEFESEQAKKELETAKREATLAVRQENLTAERAAFQKEMDFREKRFTEEVGYLKELMGQILERLPNITEKRTVSDKTTRTA